jgi:hypothetical protein
MPYKDPQKRKAASIERSKKSRELNPEAYAASKKRSVATRRERDGLDPLHSESVRRRNLKNDYGIPPEDYDQILVEQNGVCAICREKEVRTINGKVIRLSVDRDHKTNVIRGLLCTDCNRALELMKDSSIQLRMAAEYLEKSKCPR